jgi:hypothetical protein
VGIRYRPGNVGRHGVGGQPLEGLEALDTYGIGAKDPVTGLYENYDIPAGHPANRLEEAGEAIAWPAIAEQWPLIVADFASEYGVRLPDVVMRWPEFEWLVSGLFAVDSRLRRHFFPPPEPGTETDVEG